MNSSSSSKNMIGDLLRVITINSLGLFLVVLGFNAHAQWLSNIVVKPDGPPQPPLIYVHGFIDYGAPWAKDKAFL